MGNRSQGCPAAAKGRRVGRHLCAFSLLLRLMLAVPPHCGCAGQAPAWARAYQSALRTLQSGDAAGAERVFESLWKGNPADASLANAIGAAVNSAGGADQAVVWFKRALKLDPGFASAYNNLGLNYASRGLYAEALVPLRKACELDPHNSRASYNLGLVLVELRRYSEAATAFALAHEISPQEPDPLVRLAYAEMRTGRSASGSAALAKLLNLPGDRQAHLWAAVRTLNALRRYDDALRVAGEEATGADTLPLRMERAKALLGLRRYSDAVSLLAGNLSPVAPAEAYLVLGSAQALQEELADAVSTLQAAVRLDPSNPDGYYRLGLVFLAGYREEDARQVMEEGLRRMPDSTRLWNGLADVLDIAGERQEAIKALQRSVQINPRQEEAWGHLASIYSDLEAAEKALAAYSRSLRLGRSPESYANYADYLIRLERVVDAEKVAAQGLAKFPNSADLHYELGKVYQRAGKYGAAEKSLRNAIALNLHDGSVHYMLAVVLQKLDRMEEAAAEFTRTKQAKSEERQRKVLRTRLIQTAETDEQPEAARAVR